MNRGQTTTESQHFKIVTRLVFKASTTKLASEVGVLEQIRYLAFIERVLVYIRSV